MKYFPITRRRNGKAKRRRDGSSWRSGAATGHRRLCLEPLEDRRLLSIDILGVSSPHDDFRFIAGDDLPSVLNTYTANIDETAGTVSRVEFEMGGQTLTDNDPAGGWTAEFDMTTLASVTDLTVRAYEGAALGDTFNKNVDLLLLPDWFHDTGGDYSAGTSFAATHDWATGYDFDVTVNHLDLGFNTPADWVFYVPGISEPLFDLADKHTGFLVDSTFDLNSSAAGSVSATGFQIDISADVLDHTVFDESFSYSGGGSIPYNYDNGVIQVIGSFDYGASLSPSFNNDLILDGISGTAWVDPSLTVTMPLGWSKPLPFLRRFAVVPIQHARRLEHPIDARRTGRHDIRVEHHVGQPAIAFRWMLEVEAEDGVFFQR